MTSPTAADLLAYEGRLRSARSPEEIEFLIVNEPYSLLPYDQAFLWKPDLLGRSALVAASGLAEVDANSPFALWFSRAADHAKAVDTQAPVRLLAAADFPPSLNDGAEWIPRHALIIVLRTPSGESLGGLWFGRHQPFSAEDAALAAWLGQQSEFSWWAWRREQLALQSKFAALAPKRWRALSRTRKKVLLAVFCGVLFFPVRLSVLAPAEVVALAPNPVTAPVDGVVAQILVAPNQAVRAGTPLVEFDDTATRNRLLVAQKTLGVARADLARSAGKAFSDDNSKSELQLLDARVHERSAEVAYLIELLARLKLQAPTEGIALFADAEEWRGKPVQVGERIMTVADPTQVALTIYVSPDDAIALDPGAQVKMYLNISPLASRDALVTQASYETGSSPEGQPAYIVKAAFTAGDSPPRLGLKGTAKIYADRVPLIYYLLRKPLRTLRQAFGV
ncbi:efflux RND transporter periplasmic adaptor subunit [Propionivibrio sp.]|uniref:efflux RND transporter periplasmic adaptor subunit n=1 Tax=Propionivibrio sp. TaxID=2212460 RepID=UPI003BF3F87A